MRLRLAALVISAVAFAGCREKSVHVDGSDKGVNVSAPGVKVQTGGNGAKVDAPGVKVDAGAGGAKVDAPGVKVDAKP